MDTNGGVTDSRSESGTFEVTRTTHDWATTPPSIAIVETIAAIEDTDPVAISTDGGLTLADHVDPDSLDALVTEERTTVDSVTVPIGDYSIRITDRELIVHLREEPERRE